MRAHWEIIGQALREARQETEQSQRNTALRLGMKPSDYAKTEDGELSPDFVLETLMWALVERDEAREALRRIVDLGKTMPEEAEEVRIARETLEAAK